MKNMAKKTNIFKKFLYSYLYVLVLPMLMCILLYIIIFVNLNAQNEKRYSNEIEKAVNAINSELTNIDFVSTQMVNNNILKDYINYRSVDNTMDISSLFNIYQVSDKTIDNIYMYTPSNDYVITADTILRVNMVYGEMIRCGDYTYEQFRDDILTKRIYKQMVSLDNYKFINKSGDYLAYICSMPIAGKGEVTGQIIITIKKPDIKRIFEETIDIPINALIRDREGNELYRQTSIENKRVELFYTTEINGYKYEINISRQDLTDSAAGMKRWIFVVLLLIVLISAFITYKSMDKNVSPVDKLLKTVNKNSDQNITLDNLGELFDDIMKKEISLSNEISANREIVKSSLIERLYNGELDGEEDFWENIDSLQVDFRGKVYVVCAVEISFDNKTTYRQLNGIKIVLNRMIEESFIFLCTDINASTEVYVFSFEEDNIEENLLQIEEFFINAAAMFGKDSGIRFKIAVSDFYAKITEAADVIEKTVNTVVSGIHTYMDGITWCSMAGDIEKEPYHFPIKLKQKIRADFINKEYDKAYMAIDKVYKENHKNAVVYRDEIEILIFEFKILIRSIIKECRMSEQDYSKVNEMLSFIDNDSIHEDNFSKFKDILRFIADKREVSEERVDDSIGQKMIEYINENYSDPNMCRQTLAERFNISPQYASKCFKAKVGENFLDYLEKVRIEAACKLLLEGKSVEKAAQTVGYLSVVSFRRVFKKIMGQTPTQYINSEQ